jgi:hypothetical protein
MGYQFTVGSEPLLVTDLGFWDNFNDGLANPHQVGIWVTTGGGTAADAVVSGTAPAGTAATLLDGFRYVPVTPTVLAANTDYIIGTFWPVDVMAGGPDAPIGGAANLVGFTTTGITFGIAKNNATTAFSRPLADLAGPFFNPGVFGPNFQFQGVPEPSSLALFGMASLARLGLAAWRKRKQRQRVEAAPVA